MCIIIFGCRSMFLISLSQEVKQKKLFQMSDVIALLVIDLFHMKYCLHYCLIKKRATGCITV